MKFEKAFEAFAAFLETFSVAMTAANSINPVAHPQTHLTLIIPVSS
jgi:hypothetical protein